MLFRKTIIIFMATLLACGPVRADISSDLTDFWNDLGGTANVTAPTAFAGQAAGYYTGGNIRARLPSRDTAIFSVSEPSFAGGCGGIDIFSGSLSFINKDELIQLSRAIAANAVGYAFDLALETISPVIAETMKDLRARLQELNLNNINSCETAQGLVDSVIGKESLARNKLCERIGTVKGLYTDPADAKDTCGTPAAYRDSEAAANDEEKATLPSNKNLTWDFMRGEERIRPGDWLASDKQLAELAMTIAGTIITGDAGEKEYYGPKILNEEALNHLYEGGDLEYYRCVEPEKCLDITIATLSIPAIDSIRGRVSESFNRMVGNIQNNTRIEDRDIALVNGTAIPIWRVLNVYSAENINILTSRSEVVIDLVASDIMLSWLEGLLNVVTVRAQGSQLNGFPSVEKWKDQLKETKTLITDRRRKNSEKHIASLNVIDRVLAIEERLSYKLANSTGNNIWAALGKK